MVVHVGRTASALCFVQISSATSSHPQNSQESVQLLKSNLADWTCWHFQHVDCTLWFTNLLTSGDIWCANMHIRAEVLFVVEPHGAAHDMLHKY